MTGLNRSRGFTLVECLMALVVGMIVLAPLATAFKLGLDRWQDAYEEVELLSHAQLAMARMTNDLRYAVILDQLAVTATSCEVQFFTRYLETDTWLDNNLAVKFMWPCAPDGNVLCRGIEGGSNYILAGDLARSLEVNAFTVTAYKNSAGALIALSGSDTPDMAVVLKLELTLKNTAKNYSVKVVSYVKLRNRAN